MLQFLIPLLVGAQTVTAVGSARQQKKATAAQQRIELAQQLKQRREAVREMQIRRAQIVNTAAITGTSGSSGEAGAISSLGSQVGSSLAFNRFTQDLSLYAGKRLQSAADLATISQVAGTAAQLGMQFYNPTPKMPDATPTPQPAPQPVAVSNPVDVRLGNGGSIFSPPTQVTFGTP